MYSPLHEFYKHYKTHINDMVVILFMYCFIYLGDSIVYSLGRNSPLVGLTFSEIGYLSLRYIIRRANKQSEFGGFANYGPIYTLIVATTVYILYYIFIRTETFPATYIFGNFKM